MASVGLTENPEVQNDTNQWGQAILRSKTTLIKPYSKVKELKKLIIQFIFIL
jgi:hypothetical protein